jgi:hypothetical protein
MERWSGDVSTSPADCFANGNGRALSGSFVNMIGKE